MTSPVLLSGSTGGYSGSFPRPFKVATAMPSSCWGPRVTERLNIIGLGHRGDGVANTSEGPVYVPFTLPGETVTVETVAGHPDRRHLVHVDKPSHERSKPVSKHFGVCGGWLVEHWEEGGYHLWKGFIIVG